MFTDAEIMLMAARNDDQRQFEKDFRTQEANHARQMRIQKARAALEATSLNRKIEEQRIEAEMRAVMDGFIDDIRSKGVKVPDDYFLALKGFVEADLMEIGITPMQAIPGALPAFRKYEQQFLAKRAAAKPVSRVLTAEEKEVEGYARMLGVSLEDSQRSRAAALLAKANRSHDKREQKRLADEVMRIIDPKAEEERIRHEQSMVETLTWRRDRHAKGEELRSARDSFFLAALAIYPRQERASHLRRFVEPLLTWKEKLVLKLTGRLPTWSGAYD